MLDPIKLSTPTKDDLLNLLGCSLPEDRIELGWLIGSKFPTYTTKNTPNP